MLVECPRCGDAGVAPTSDRHEDGRIVFVFCSCVLGTLTRAQAARAVAGGLPRVYESFYAQRALPYRRRDNAWRPSE